MSIHTNSVGLVPAAGQASRLGPLPCSKEVLPIGFTQDSTGVPQLRVAAHHLLEAFTLAGVQQAFVILRTGKWDIPSYLGGGQTLGLDLAYLLTSSSRGVPYTLNAAFPFVRQARVMMGFPDILFRPPDAFRHLLAKLEESRAEVVLGTFPTDEPERSDMVALDSNGRVREIIVKPPRTTLSSSWALAAWTPTFTRYLHDLLQQRGESVEELFLGRVFQEAIEEGMTLQSVSFPEGRFIDIGTAEGLRAATGSWRARERPVGGSASSA